MHNLGFDTLNIDSLYLTDGQNETTLIPLKGELALVLPGACLLILDPDHFSTPKSSWYDIPDRAVTVVSATNALCGGLTESDGFLLTYGSKKRVVSSFVSKEYELSDSTKLQFETSLVESDSNVLAWNVSDSAFILEHPSIGTWNYLEFGFFGAYELGTISNGQLQISLRCNNYDKRLDSLSIHQGGITLWSQSVAGISGFEEKVLISPGSGELELVYYGDTTLVERLSINHLYPKEVTVTITEVSPRDAVEWLEIHNEGERAVSLDGWGILIGGDTITVVGGVVNVGEYVVLSSANEFAPFEYLELGKRVTMNNYSDTLYLLSPWGVVDSISWDYKKFEFWDSETLNRKGQSQFLCSASPGEKTTCSGQEILELTIYPKIFSPDGDGVDDQVTITLGSAYGIEYELSLWAISGDLLYTHRTTEPDTLVWNGIDRHGNSVPRGPVLVHLQADGRETRGELILWR